VISADEISPPVKEELKLGSRLSGVRRQPQKVHLGGCWWLHHDDLDCIGNESTKVSSLINRIMHGVNFRQLLGSVLEQ
jgi:hypothetical protein